MLSPIAREILEFYPAAEPAGHRQQLAGPRVQHGQRGSDPDPRRSEPWQQDSPVACATTGTTAAPAISARSPVPGIDQPRVNHNTLVSYTHTLTPTLHNDFRIGYHRVGFDTLNHFAVNGRHDAGAIAGHSGVRRRRAGTTIPAFRASTSATSAGWAAAARTGISSTRRSRCRTCWRTPGDRTTSAPGSTCGRMATGRRAANDPRGVVHDFTGAICTGYAVADFMLGLPRTVIPPTDQIQGHVGGWRNGFFVNDVWQASHDLTLSLGLRYELNTPVQTYEGLASMLDEDSRRSFLPTEFPVPRVRVPRAELQGLRPAAGRDLSARREDRSARGLRDLLQPEPDELVHVPDQQPADGGGVHVHLGPREPDAVFRAPVRRRRARRAGRTSSRRRGDLPNARKDQWSFDLQRELWRGHRAGRAVRRLEHRATWIAASSTTRRSRVRGGRSAAAEPAVPPAADHRERSRSPTTMRSASSSAAHEPRPAGGRALHLVAHARHGHAFERRRQDDGQLRHLAGLRSRRTGTSRTASSRATSTTCRS